MRRLAFVVVLSLISSLAFAGQKQLRGSQITGELKRDLKRTVEKTTAWKSKLGGKPGDKMRPFQASSIRHVVIPGPAPAGAQGGARIAIGWIVTGKISTTSGRTYVQGKAQPRSAPTAAPAASR